jgi:hypothetical protein
VSLVVVAGELPAPYARRVKKLPFDDRVKDSVGKISTFLRLKPYYITNNVEQVGVGSTVEKDYDVPTPPTVKAIGWLDDLSLRQLRGEVGVILHEPKDLNDLAYLIHFNKTTIFHVEFSPEAEPDFQVLAILLLSSNPRVKFRDHSAYYVLGMPTPPPEHIIIYGYEVVKGYNFRAFLTRIPVRRYTVLGTSYIASGYYTPEKDPFVYYLSTITGSQPSLLFLDGDFGPDLAPQNPGSQNQDNGPNYQQDAEEPEVDESVQDEG